MNEWEMRYRALLLGITDSRMIDNAERLVEVAIRQGTGTPLSIMEAFWMIVQSVRVQQNTPPELIDDAISGESPSYTRHEHERREYFTHTCPKCGGRIVT